MLNKIKSFFGILSTLQISLFTSLHGKKMGTDMFGNVYYTGKPRPYSNRERRWVVYNGIAEASKVPPEWHGWLHHQTDVFPSLEDTNPYRQSWQKPHMPNLTGTAWGLQSFFCKRRLRRCYTQIHLWVLYP